MKKYFILLSLLINVNFNYLDSIQRTIIAHYPNKRIFNSIFSLLTPYNINNYSRLRIGKNNDGGYVIPPELISEITKCYTYGVANDISFELDLINLKKDIIVHAYDHTVSHPSKMAPNIFFKQEGISSKKTGKLNTLKNHISENNDLNNNFILKMDIEGAEWNVLKSIKENIFENIPILILELHWFKKTNLLTKYQRILKKLESMFTVFHIHGNNCGLFLNVNGKIFPNVIEVTYINNRYINQKNTINKSLTENPETANCPGASFYTLDFWL